MPRPKGSFKTPEQLANMTPEQREKYKLNHADYIKNFQRREKRRREIPSSMILAQRRADKIPIPWDKFPVSIFRVWLETHFENQRQLRLQAVRWGTTSKSISEFLSGRKLLRQECLDKIHTDTMISLDRLKSDYDTLHAKFLNLE